MSRVAELLEERREELLRRWMQRVQRARPSSPAPLEDLLDALGRLLREQPPPGDASALARMAELGAEHGRRREHEGFTQDVLVREYAELREVIFELLDEARWEVPLGPLRLLTRALDQGLEAAVARFSAQREVQRTASAEAQRAAEALAHQHEARQRGLEQQAREAEEVLHLATRSARIGTWTLNPSTGASWWDARTKELFGLPAEAPTRYDTFVAALHPEDRDRAIQAIWTACDPSSGGEYTSEYRTVGLQDGGVIRWIQSRGKADFDARGRAVRLAGVSQDVTADKRQEEDSRRRADFEQQLIGIVSHDLRNPLGAILLATATLLRRAGLDERQTATLHRIVASAERASRMIRDILDFTQARLGGGLRIEPRPLDPNELIHGVVEEARLAGMQRELAVEGEAQGQVEWDSDRMAQVLTNLLSNAVRHAAEGTRVTVRTWSQGEYVSLGVHNLGTPISEELLARLFQPMDRGPGQKDRSGRSLGLGLFIVDHIVRAHGGTLEVRSTAEQGTLFTARLPRRAGAGLQGLRST